MVSPDNAELCEYPNAYNGLPADTFPSAIACWIA
jgi:hypothetical protein